MDRRGFTLLEMLIAMSLMALLTVGLTSGIQFGARVWDRAGDGRAEIQDQQTAYVLLRRVLTQMVSQSLSQEATARTVTFAGGAERMRMIGTAPARAARPGMYLIEIALEDAGAGRQDLVLRWQPSVHDALTAPMTEADRRTLLSGLEGARFSYFGNREEGWVARWGGRVDLPQLVRLRSDRIGAVSLFGEAVFATRLGIPDISVGASER